MVDEVTAVRRPPLIVCCRRGYCLAGVSVFSSWGFTSFFFCVFFLAFLVSACFSAVPFSADVSFFSALPAPVDPPQPLCAFSLALPAPEEPPQPLAPDTGPGALTPAAATSDAMPSPASNCFIFSFPIRTSFDIETLVLQVNELYRRRYRTQACCIQGISAGFAAPPYLILNIGYT